MFVTDDYGFSEKDELVPLQSTLDYVHNKLIFVSLCVYMYIRYSSHSIHFILQVVPEHPSWNKLCTFSTIDNGMTYILTRVYIVVVADHSFWNTELSSSVS